MKSTRFVFLSLLSCIVVFVLSCSTKKNTGISRAYHNLNARYNIYFNGIESYKKGKFNIAKSYQDNYTKILQVFKFDEAAASAGSGDMDKSIEKSSKLIKKHSITSKPKKKGGNKSLSKKEKEFYKKANYCNWIDDAYLLMAKSYYFKRDFTNCESNCEFIFQKFNDKEIEAETRMVKAKSNVEEKNFKEAGSSLGAINPEDLDRNQKIDLELLKADMNIKQENYDDAVPHLEKALKLIKRKKDRTRYLFILAQIYTKQEKLEKAREYYKLVIQSNPPYELAFNAKINLATILDSDQGNTYVKRLLTKMLRDEKNIDYLDQIYYALGNISMSEKDTSMAKNYYKYSSEKSKLNKNQKAISCLALADIYFNQQRYQIAQAYYDSTIVNLDKDYPNYEALFIKTQNLSELVKNMEIIQREDSVQKIAAMKEEDRLKYIDQIIDKVKRDEEQKKLANQSNNQSNIDFTDFNNIQSNSTFPMYNTTTLSRGQQLFKKKWGDRKLEDNWRRRNKAAVISDVEETKDDDLADADDGKFSNKDREYYLKGLPLTDSLLLVSNKRLVKAHYQIGEIYYHKINDYDEAIAAYEVFIKRFPSSNALLDTYYNLYQLNLLVKDEKRAEFYKNKIITEFPQSPYSKMFTNPNYANELKLELKKVEDTYTEAYNRFVARDFDAVIQSFEVISKQYPGNVFLPKFHLLMAMSKGGKYAPDVSEYKKELKEIISKYSDSDVKGAANDYLSELEKDPTKIEEKEIEIYSYKPTAKHFFIMALRSEKLDINKLRFNLIKFNINNFNQLNIDAEIVELRADARLIVVQPFKNQSQAKEYFDKINADKATFEGSSKSEIELYLIDEKNYEVLMGDRELNKYKLFHQKNYK